MSTLENRTYTTKEAADKFGYAHSDSIRQLCHKLKVGVKVGRDWLLTEADLVRIENFLEKFGRQRKNA